jgi:hypothetical protein
MSSDLHFIFDILMGNNISKDLAIKVDTMFTELATIYNQSICDNENHIIKYLLKHLVNRICFLKTLIHKFCSIKNITYKPSNVDFDVPDVMNTFLTFDYLPERYAMESDSYHNKDLQNVLFSNYTTLRKFYYYIEVVASSIWPDLSPTALENMICFGNL